MTRKFPAVCLMLVLVCWLTPASAKIKVVATLPVLGDLAEQVGGERVEVSAVARGNQDPHYVEVLPSHMLKLRKADVFLMVGMDLELWAKPLIDGSRNRKLQVIDCSESIDPLEVPKFKVDARYGDLHPQGNPHYWLNPANIPAVCAEIRDALIAVDPEGTKQYRAGTQEYLARLDIKLAGWNEQCAKLHGMSVVAYHNSWPYFCAFCGIETVAFVEEFPGVAPSPSHLSLLLARLRAEQIPAIVVQPHHDRRVPEMLARKSGAEVVVLPSNVGGIKAADSYITMIDAIIERLSAHHQPSGGTQ